MNVMKRRLKCHEQPEPFKAAYAEQKQRTKEYLKAEVERLYRVINTSGSTKGDLINLILEAEGWFTNIKQAPRKVKHPEGHVFELLGYVVGCSMPLYRNSNGSEKHIPVYDIEKHFEILEY